MKRSDFLMDLGDIVDDILDCAKKGEEVYLIKERKLRDIENESKKYKWLYHVVCLALHDTIEIPLEEIKKDFEHLWDLKSAREENKKNVN